MIQEKLDQKGRSYDLHLKIVNDRIACNSASKLFHKHGVYSVFDE